MGPSFSARWMRCACAQAWRFCGQRNPILPERSSIALPCGWSSTRRSFPGDFQTGVLGDSPEDRERFESFADEAPCPALDTETGRCDVYAWRPMTCRLFGPPVRMGDGQALAHCELCFKGASEAEVAACEMEVPFELEAETARRDSIEERDRGGFCAAQVSPASLRATLVLGPLDANTPLLG